MISFVRDEKKCKIIYFLIIIAFVYLVTSIATEILL